MGAPKLIHRDSSGWVGSSGDVLLQCFQQPADIERMKKRHAIELAFLEQHRTPKYIVVTVVLEPAITKLANEMRELTTEHTKVTAPFTRAGALVLHAPGFKAAFIRGILSSILLVSGAGFPFKVTGENDEAFQFVAPHLLPPMTPNELKTAWAALDQMV